LRLHPEFYALEGVDHELPQGFGRNAVRRTALLGQASGVRFLEIWSKRVNHRTIIDFFLGHFDGDDLAAVGIDTAI
jgi:hypothetical protein